MAITFSHPQAEPKEDFSHLPPAQRIKKLEAKVKEVEGAIGKANADKCVSPTVHTHTPLTHGFIFLLCQHVLDPRLRRVHFSNLHCVVLFWCLECCVWTLDPCTLHTQLVGLVL